MKSPEAAAVNVSEVPATRGAGPLILPGTVLPPGHRRDALEKLLGRVLPEEVWAQNPTGHRLLVVPEPVSERVAGGLLWKPRSVQKRQELEMGAGWVLAAGPLVGSPGAPHPAGLLCAAPAHSLGLHVIFRQYSGTNLRISDEDTEFEGNLIMLTDRDVLSWSPGV